MSGIFRTGDVMGEARKAAAKNLMAAVVLFENHITQKLGERPAKAEKRKITRGPNKGKSRLVYIPPFSTKGEYPMKRTGFLQRNIVHEPTSLAEVEKTLSVRVGYSANAYYGAILEFKMERLGLEETLKSLRKELALLASGSIHV